MTEAAVIGPRLGSAYKDAKRDRRRSEILDAAAAVFARKGYFNATMQDIADLLGLRSASLYYYFRTKEAALEEVCRLGGRAYVEQLQALLAAQGRTFPDILDAALREHLDSRWRDYVASFAFNRQNLPERALAEMRGIARDYTALWQGLLERGKASGDLAADLDTAFAARAVLAVANSAASQRDDRDADATIAAVRRFVLRGIGG